MLVKFRQEVWEANMQLPREHLITLTSGNVSGRDPESGLVVIKPSGVSYDVLTPADLVILDVSGKIIEGHLKPSTDTDTHLYIYRHRPDINGVTHTHSTFACVFAALGRPIPACLTYVGTIGGEIPLGSYVPIGGEEIGEEVVRKIGDKYAIIMQNHGVFAIGKDARESVNMAVMTEEIAKITYFAMLIGKPIFLTEEQVSFMKNIYHHTYGQHGDIAGKR